VPRCWPAARKASGRAVCPLRPWPGDLRQPVDSFARDFYRYTNIIE
jgi:hypothetical protein